MKNYECTLAFNEGIFSDECWEYQTCDDVESDDYYEDWITEHKMQEMREEQWERLR